MTGPLPDRFAPLLLDENTEPPVRDRIGDLMTRADTVEFALQRIRLAALDLSEAELGGVRRCRVLLGQLDAATLLDGTESALSPERRRALHRLREFVDSGRLRVRSAGLGAWTPDFSVYSRGGRRVALFGAHFFGSPYLLVGPSLTYTVTDRASVDLARRRFAGLWRRSHDVLPAIREVLERADGVATRVAP